MLLRLIMLGLVVPMPVRWIWWIWCEARPLCWALACRMVPVE